MRDSPSLQVEEVVTLDGLRHDIPQAIEVYGVFEEGRRCILTRELEGRGLLRRIANWRPYVVETIGPDVLLLESMEQREAAALRHVQGAPLGRMITRAIRAEFRVAYFAHGRNVAYNYAVMRNMFLGRTEATAQQPSGFARVRPLDDDDDDDETFAYPLFCAKLPQRVVTAARLVWETQRALDRAGLRDADATRRLLTTCAVWAYGHALLTEAARKRLRASVVADAACADDPTTLFAWQTVVEAYGAHLPAYA